MGLVGVLGELEATATRKIRRLYATKKRLRGSPLIAFAPIGYVNEQQLLTSNNQ
jgi:hypothetical protein